MSESTEPSLNQRANAESPGMQETSAPTPVTSDFVRLSGSALNPDPEAN